MNQKTTAFFTIAGIILTVALMLAIVSVSGVEGQAQPVSPYYTAGDLVRASNATLFVVVTGYDAEADTYTFQPAEVNLHAGTREVLPGALTMDRLQFQEEYNTKVTLHK